MLKFQLATPEDMKLAAKIEHKRRVEETRKPRIFNSRFRKIGIDRDFLDRQIEEKKQQREFEEARECRQDDALVRSSKLAMLLERQQEEEKRRIRQEIESFRRHCQRAQDRRDYDLYDPDSLKKSSPARKDDDHRHLGLASAQVFEGEDSKMADRLKAQKEQMRWWIARQTEERTIAERERQEAEKMYQEAVVARDKRATTLNEIEEECRRRLNEATARFNRALAEEQDHRRRLEAAQDEEDKRAEIQNSVTGDFLTESREQANSNRGPDRPLASRYKGMTADELRKYRDEQAQQMREIEKMRVEEKRMNEYWDQLMLSHSREAQIYQRELDRKRAEINKKIAEDNLQLAQKQKSRQEYLNRILYKNSPTPDFFEQFNKTTR